MCVMAQNQDHRARSQVMWPRQFSELNTVEISGFVAVAIQVAGQPVSIEASGKSRVVATPPVGFGRAGGGAPIKMRAAHITKPSTGRVVTYGPAKPGWFCGRAG
jgi:hypothetical protein